MFLDQLPHMRDLQMFIEHLSVTETPSTSSTRNLIIEQVPEVRQRLLNMYKGRYQNIAQQQLKQYFSMTGGAMKVRGFQKSLYCPPANSL